MSDVYMKCPHTVLSIAEVDMSLKHAHYFKAVEDGELGHRIDQFRLFQPYLTAGDLTWTP